MNLTEFLLARIAEDESNDTALVGVARKDWTARWATECAAKRRIVDLHRKTWDGFDCALCDGGFWDESDDGSEVYAAKPEEYPCGTLRALALPYADHPDFDEAWRV